MLNVMIADDELIIREGIRTFINWDKLDCMVAYTATDGLDAIHFLETHPVDIVITDIRMPGKNGLELTRYIKETHPLTQVIILSGYADFKYAQEALRQGAFDFILKNNPLSKIESSVSRAADKVRQQQEKERSLNDIRATINNEKEELRIKFYNDLIYGIPMSDKTMAEKIDSYQITAENICCILIKISINGNSACVSTEFLSAVMCFLSNIFCSVEPVVFPIQGNNVCLLINNASALEHTPLMPTLRQFFKFTEQYPDYSLAAAVSAVHHSVKELNAAYMECCYCFKYNTKKRKKILFFKDEHNQNTPPVSFNQSNQTIKKAMLFMENNYNKPITLPDIADAVNLNPSYFSRLFKKENGLSVTEYLTQFRLEKAKELLKDNSLRLRDVAESIGFNDISYFSNTFKKYTGMSPTEYRTISGTDSF